MPRRALLVVLAVLAGLSIACRCGRKTPKPWVKREGQKEIVGNPTDADREGEGEGEPEVIVRRPTTERVDPVVASYLPPVADSYEELAAAGTIAACPEDTVLVDERRAHREMYCTLSDGLRHGPYMEWHTNGVVKEVGPYVGGKRHGTWVAWDRKGKKYSTYRWENGTPMGGEVHR